MTDNMELPDDIESLFGLWVIFELPKCSKEEQNRVMDKIKSGDYPKNNNIEQTSECNHQQRYREYYREGCYKCWECHKVIVE